MRRLDAYWYHDNLLSRLLAPLGWLFCLLAVLRRRFYGYGWLASSRLPVPVIVVGNITVGGSGKTPLVIYLVELLRRHGYRPGVISRGYGGQAGHWPQQVTARSDPLMVGDEPVLIVRRTGVPMAVGPDRIAAAQHLLRQEDCDLLIADDGLQHYRLRRDVEIAVVDAARRFGNGRCLPAGPLREPRRRLSEVDMVIGNGQAVEGGLVMTLAPHAVLNLRDGSKTTLAQFSGQRVHALAGIGAPQRFFEMLRQAGIDVIEHPFPDHHRFSAQDLIMDDDLPLLMTEKDGVKCLPYACGREWMVAVDAQLPDEFTERLLGCLKR